jgi:hypothetical protein
MRVGAWFHNHDDLPLEGQLEQAAHSGIVAARAYDIAYAETIAPVLKRYQMSLLAGIDINADALLRDWRSQVRFEELMRYIELGVALDGLCVGNELREGGDAPDQKRFTPALAHNLATVINTYRHWLLQHDYQMPLTYAMESIVFDDSGRFHDWMQPLIEACDVISLNAYPLDNAGWFTYGAFEESRRFLCDPGVRRERLARFEDGLRQSLSQVHAMGKRVYLSEMGFPSAVGYSVEGERGAGRRNVIPHSDNERYADAMREFIDVLNSVSADYGDIIETIYFYEWRDNLNHFKIWNVEQSPIHTAFGLCDASGTAKLDISQLVAQASQQQRSEAA